MTTAPTLVFLHGVGDGDQDDKWKATLSESLVRLEYPGLESAEVVAPKYAHALKDWDVRETLPDYTGKAPTREAAKTNRRAFENRMGAVERRLGVHNQGKGFQALDTVVSASVAVPYFKQARNYLSNPQIRAQVLNRVLNALPSTGRIVLVGHSLGSVIAADVLRRLPAEVEVVGMVTIGSPLANGAFDVDKLKDGLKEPPLSLAWWVNFWNALDPVAAHRGLSSAFPWMVDFRIATTPSFVRGHLAEEYLGSDAVGAAIGYALFGSLSTELEAVERGVDIPLDPAESMALMALRYAHLMRRRLKGDELDRFTGALRRVQTDVVTDILTRNENEGRQVPANVTRLLADPSGKAGDLAEPQPGRYLGKDEAVVLLTVLAAENVLRPFEIDLPREKWLEAMKELCAEMGLGTQYGIDIFEAAKRARTVLSPGRAPSWLRLGALSAGAAALVVATGGLPLMAASGVAGAAAITSALAAFGPGGMIGGLVTAGSLLLASGGGIAYGLAGQGTTAETLEAVVERRLAATILRQLQGLEPDPAVWSVLVQIEIEVRRQHERMDEFSDESAPGLKDLKRKILTVERALHYLTENGLEPGAVSAQQ